MVRFCLFSFALLSSGQNRSPSETNHPMNPESKSRVIHEKLDTTFVNLWALLRNLSQRGFIGRVRVEQKDYTADVFMTGSSTPLVHEVDHAAGTDTLEEGALHRLVLRAREAPGTISVFAGADEAVAVESAAVGAGAQAASDAPEVASTNELEGGTGVPPVDRAPDGWAGNKPEDELPATLVESPPLSELPPDGSREMNEAEWDAMVRASGDLIGGVERALAGVQADFASLFRAARIELADDYTFLDPMSGGFEYENSVVTAVNELPADAYVAGVVEVLRRVVDRVAMGERARRVRERVALELFSVARKRPEILRQSGFMTQLDRIAGTKVI